MVQTLDFTISHLWDGKEDTSTDGEVFITLEGNFYHLEYVMKILIGRHWMLLELHFLFNLYKHL